MDSGREEASGGGIERGMEGEQGSKGGKLQGRYPEESTGLYIVYTVYTVPVYSIFTNHPTTRPLPLLLCYYK